MTAIDLVALKESLSRTAKIDVDSGAAANIDEAMARLRSFRLQVAVGPEVARSAAHQAALLTFVNIARRFALGGVTVAGLSASPILVAPSLGACLESAVTALGGQLGSVEAGVPTLTIGSAAVATERQAAITFEGWRGGIAGRRGPRLGETGTIMTAAVMAGAFGAAEGFAMLRGEIEAGRRSLGLSLWRPAYDWRNAESDGPALTALPDHLWVLGLGHLGQAFLWNILLLPYADPSRVSLTLQDVDIITTSTDSTSILTTLAMVGERKTRAMARVLERRGFQTTIVERPFDGRFQRETTLDPGVLVCGVDNRLARSRLESAGFPFIVEAGLGATAQDFRAMRLHTFPTNGRSAENMWSGSMQVAEPICDQPAYRAIEKAMKDPCGLARLAGTAVGAPFVGTTAASLMLAQILRVLAGDYPDGVIDVDLESVSSRRIVPAVARSSASVRWQTLAA